MTILLDANVLIALTLAEHVHHDAADRWLAGVDSYATCPITEGSLVRMLFREGQSLQTVRMVLDGFLDDDRHEFWTDELSYRDVRLTGVIGHRQVTDAYLAELARSHRGALATFDQGLAKLHSDVASVVPTRS